MHLRNDAEFETKIGKNIFWVPVNTLGKTRYTNDEIYQMITLSPCEKKIASEIFMKLFNFF